MLSVDFQHASYGQVRVDHESDRLSVWFERVPLEEDAELVELQIHVTPEHLAAWVSCLLRSLGMRCKAGDGASGTKVVKMHQVTDQDRRLAYVLNDTAHVCVIKQGQRFPVDFALEPMDVFMRRLGEQWNQSNEHTGMSLACYLAEYVG